MIADRTCASHRPHHKRKADLGPTVQRHVIASSSSIPNLSGAHREQPQKRPPILVEKFIFELGIKIGCHLHFQLQVFAIPLVGSKLEQPATVTKTRLDLIPSCQFHSALRKFRL
eukprot:TRINITY_DN41360_c0_g1_i1.p1 TRINITY_DN41360_c0_g1~~TRINITY_DN41360_c0_g1_i1.p1  ORF type:complete len:128 (+),score=2.17 TRINITY_DN41360_c0_g1_i1:45-386(+)